jgi:hypothetical protein
MCQKRRRINRTADIVAEPDWGSVFSDMLEFAQAHEHWRRITTELKTVR